MQPRSKRTHRSQWYRCRLHPTAAAYLRAFPRGNDTREPVVDLAFWEREGYAVIEGAVSPLHCARMVSELWQMAGKCSDDPATCLVPAHVCRGHALCHTLPNADELASRFGMSHGPGSAAQSDSVGYSFFTTNAPCFH
jgi:hypothetical protein